MVALRELRARLTSAPEVIPAVAERTAVAVKEIIDANIAAGRAPDGSSWPDRENGGKALVHAAAAVDVVAVGSTVVAAVSGIEALHDRGKVKGRVARQIIPRKTPSNVRDAIATIVDDELSKRAQR
jgi:hypothetical protein